VWLLALAAPTSVFLVALAMLRRQRRRPLALAAPLAFSLTICFEAALLNVLSAFHAVARGPLVAAHAVVGLVGAVALAASRRRAPLPRGGWRPIGADAWAARGALLLLAVPVAYSALWYLPNNWDSMTYHLARVAHWIQHRSVGAYETNVPRQVTYPPGAEYLLVVVQAIAGTDRLANLLQFVSWVVVALAAGRLARLFGAPRRIAPWAALVFAATPMAMLQASSTQNDLVASATALGIVAACLPFFHARPRWHASDVVVAASALSASVLVKPTAVITTLPFTACAVAVALRVALRDARSLRAATRGVALAAIAAALFLGPELARRAHSSDQGEFSPFLYAPLSMDADRLTNVARAFARHVPLPASWTAALASPTTVGCSVARSMCADRVLHPHEDFAGNPASTVLVLGLLLVALFRWRDLPARAKWALAAIPAAWIGFGLVFRDNPWIARLHLPLFALAPIAAAALAGRPSRMSRFGVVTASVVAVLCVHSVLTATRNELRPVPNPTFAWLGLLPSTYYAAHRGRWPSHVGAMTTLAERGCNHLGLFIGGDSYDYPLTWRAMLRGVAVRHITGPDPWPCVVLSDRGVPPAHTGGSWCATGSPDVYVPCEETAHRVTGRPQ
jgi:hypothetical protein